MDATRARRRTGIGGVALGVALAALVVGTPGAGAETPTWDRFQGEGAGRRDVVAEVTRAADEARQGWGAEALFAAVSGDAWASTRQFPGRPH
jgi:hypothetical protein